MLKRCMNIVNPLQMICASKIDLDLSVCPFAWRCRVSGEARVGDEKRGKSSEIIGRK